MAINTTLEVGAPVKYTQQYQLDSSGAQGTEVVGAVCANNSGIAGAGHPIDLTIVASPSGQNTGKVVKGVLYSGANPPAAGQWSPLTSASNFA